MITRVEMRNGTITISSVNKKMKQTDDEDLKQKNKTRMEG